MLCRKVYGRSYACSGCWEYGHFLNGKIVGVCTQVTGVARGSMHAHLTCIISSMLEVAYVIII